MINFDKPQKSKVENDQEARQDSITLTEKEVEKVRQEIIKICEREGQKVDEAQITTHVRDEGLHDLVFSFPQCFDPERVAQVAIKESEFAPKLVRFLAEQEKFDDILEVLRHYQGSVFFDYCVSGIERALSNNEKQDEILMQLSEAIEDDSVKEKKAQIEDFSEVMLNRPEKAARSLETYQSFLKLNDKKLRDALDRETLLLIGGGVAPIKKGLEVKGVDCEVTNIEPMLDSAKDNQKNADHPLPENFYKIDIEKLGKFQEVWSANNSLPTYAFNPEQVKIFYQKSLQAVKPGGCLRVLPVLGFSDALTPAMRLNRIPTNNASKEMVEKIKSRPDLFEVKEFQSPEIRSFFGKKNKMQGVNIKVIGKQSEIDEFLAELDK